MIKLLGRLSLALIMFGCLASAADAQSSKPITLAVQLDSDIPQILLAQDRNIWHDQGIEVRLIPFSSGREAFEALAGGQADICVIADLPATIAALRNQRFRILADISRYAGQRVIASRKRMNLTSMKDLNGVKLGTTLGTSVEYLTALVLQAGHANAQIVNLAPPDMVPALVRGDIDASVMFPSLYAQAKKALGADYQEIIAKDYASHVVLVATPTMINDRPADLDKFIKAVLVGDDLTARDPGAAQKSVIDASKGLMAPSILAGMWPDYDYKLVLKDDLVSMMAAEAVWVLGKGMIKAEPDKATPAAMLKFFDPEPLRRLAPANVQLSAAK